MKSHFIRSKLSGLYFQNAPDVDHPMPTAGHRGEADLYEQEDACAIATRFYGPDGYQLGKWEIIEATPQERHLWVSRRGGRTRTAAQARARKRNGERHGGRYRVCRSCGGRVERTQPAETHLCVKCSQPTEQP